MNNSPDPPGVAVRRAALRLLDAVLRRGLPLDSAFDAAAAGIERADDRGLVYAIATACLRWLPDLDALIDGATAKRLPHDAKARFALRIALTQALILKTPDHAAIATVLPLVDGGPRKLVHGVFGTVRRREASLPDVPHLPDDLAARWRESWGAEAIDHARHAIAAPPPLDLTFADAAEAPAFAERAGGRSLLPGHARLTAGTRVPDLPGYDEGTWWVQDVAASLPARMLGCGEGRTVLDLNAAPGGKTMQLAAAGWRVTAVDLSEARMRTLEENLRRTRLSVETVIADALFYDPGRSFDAVLVDAPCSATGIFRRHPDVIHRVRPKAIVALAERQSAILARAAMAVKPGGHLVYAVCSLEPQEGEQVMERFLASHGAFSLAAPDEAALGPFRSSQPSAIRITPGCFAESGGADGFFAAMFHRKDGTAAPSA